MEKENLALELLTELKHNAKRWFIIALIELVIIIATNVGWLLYESQYETIEETETQTMDDIQDTDNSNFSQNIN